MWHQHAAPLSIRSSCWSSSLLVDQCHAFLIARKVSEQTWVALSFLSLLSMFSSTQISMYLTILYQLHFLWNLIDQCNKGSLCISEWVVWVDLAPMVGKGIFICNTSQKAQRVLCISIILCLVNSGTF